jgi:hypothetical protein
MGERGAAAATPGIVKLVLPPGRAGGTPLVISMIDVPKRLELLPLSVL